MHTEPSTLLRDKKVAVLMTDGVEQIEYTQPRRFLEGHGAEVTLVAPKAAGEVVQGFKHLTPGAHFHVDMDVRDARAQDFDALVLPGGVANPDRLRLNSDSVELIREFARLDKPIAAICHGPWTLIEACVVQDRRLTSWPSLKEDLLNAGALWVDEAVVVDGKLVTSRKPEDLAAFEAALLAQLIGDLSGEPGQTASAGSATESVSETVHNVQEEPGSQNTG